MIIRVMSSNIWGDYFGNEVTVRDRQLEGIYRKYSPDIIGLQEMTQNWWESPIWESLEEEYQFVPTSTGGKLNYTPMLYRNKVFTVVDSGWYLYHEELDCSKGYTWAVFRVHMTGERFAVFNTHFMWTRTEADALVYDTIRRYNAMELIDAIKKISGIYNCPAFFMGDLNCPEDSLAWRYLNREDWCTSYSIAAECSEVCSEHGDPRRGADGRYHGELTDESKECSIDHIGMKRGTVVHKQAAVIDQAALDATDHTPIYADITI